MKTCLAAVAVMAAAFSAPALAATGLDCLDTGYTTEEQATFAGFEAGFSFVAFQNEEQSEKMLEPLNPALGRRAEVCMAQHGWSEKAMEQALFHKISGLLLAAIDRNTVLTPQLHGKLRAFAANGDQARLRRVFAPMVNRANAAQADPDQAKADAEYFVGQLITDGFNPDDTTSLEYVGAWFGAKYGAELAAEQFAKE